MNQSVLNQLNQQKLNQLANKIQSSNKIVFFTGAGVSTESGIPDFRSTNGIYNQKYKYPPEEIISHTFFEQNPLEFYQFYRDKMVYPQAEPNITHRFIAKIERLGKLSTVITQNIDGLHQKAGCKKVIELHGSILRNYCQKCHKLFGLDSIISTEGIPHCECGGIIKPDVVLYEENLNEADIRNAIIAIQQADLLIVAGTSLSVYPAAGMIRYYGGDDLVLINKTRTQYDEYANILLPLELGTVFDYLDKKIK